MKRYLAHIALAILIYLSWYWPGSTTGAVFAVAASLMLAFLGADKGALSYRSFYLCGVIVNILGFYWLADTIQEFGGFPAILSWLIFGFFVAVSSLQFFLFAFIFNRLPASAGYLRLALAWVSAEYLCPRIFPWELGHPLIGIPALVQVSDIAGSPLVSLLVLTASSMAAAIVFQKQAKSKLVPILYLLTLLTLWYGYGAIRIAEFSKSGTNPLKVSIAQASVEVVKEGNLATIRQNKQSYISLSRAISPATELLIWPEAVIQDWISIDTQVVDQDPRLPFFGPGTSLLTGALTFESQKIFFNSALLISKNGLIAAPYHKRILMPYGEYMPFSSIFPWLNTINTNLALFTAGTSMSVFDVPSGNPAKAATKISPLICYEDLIPRLARTATNMGAEVLVNLTNDAWFGDGLAAVHHNMMASFRAIENRRFLIRSTNNGLTAIVNPIGQTVRSLKPKSEGLLEAEVYPLQTLSLFTKYFGPWLWWVLSLLTLGLALRLRKHNAST